MTLADGPNDGGMLDVVGFDSFCAGSDGRFCPMKRRSLLGRRSRGVAQ